jgi:hypothetical protein
MRAKHQLLFIQGGGKGAHDEWDNKLVASLRQELGQDYEIDYPRMPSEDNPTYSLWKTALESVFETLQHGAILVGLGGCNDSPQNTHGAIIHPKLRRDLLDRCTVRWRWGLVSRRTAVPA